MTAVSDELRVCVGKAWSARQSFRHLDAYRVFDGYAEGQPGIEIDKYGSALVIRHRADCSELIGDVVAALDHFQRFELIVAREIRLSAAPVVVRGLMPSERSLIGEGPMRFAIDVARAGNPGLFLDARPARAWLLENSAQRRILNLFAFTGSLGIAAAVGGATSVTHVDSHAGVLQWARDNSGLNQITVDDRDFARLNIYQHLRKKSMAKQRYGGIIVDPPPGPASPRHKDRTPGQRGVLGLAPLLTKMMAPGGWLLCLFHHQPGLRKRVEDEFSRRSAHALNVIWRGTSDADFPGSEKLWITCFQRPE